MTSCCTSSEGGSRDSEYTDLPAHRSESEYPGELAGLVPHAFGHVFTVTTRHRFELINLTERVQELVSKTGIHTGIALLQSLHSTAALFVNEWQDALLQDFRTLLEEVVRTDASWRHNDPRYSDCDRGNGASHLRAMLLGSNAMLAVRRGELVRGTWQSIIFAELDGPRTRSVSLQVLGA